MASAFTLVCNIIAKRVVQLEDKGTMANMYYLNDGVYGSFNCTIFDHVTVRPIPLVFQENLDDREMRLSTVWGPTCDSMDCIAQNLVLPEMHIGEWMVFKEMGAYTMCAASNFNGFKIPSLKYYLTSYTLDVLKSLRSWSRIHRLIENSGENAIEEDDSLLETFSFDQIENYIKVH